MIEAGDAAGAGEAWRGYRDAFAALCYRLPRKVTPDSVVPLVDALHALAVEISEALKSLISNHTLAGNDAQNEAHIENSKPEALTEFEPVKREEQKASAEPKAVPLSVVLKACPDITMYDRNGIQSWRDLVSTAGLVRGILGISASAWDAARDAMGEHGAAIAVAGILQRAEAIKSPGGYLRGLTQKSRAGKFSAWPMMMALLRKASTRPS